MSDLEFDLDEIQETDPIKAIIAIDRQVRPKITNMGSADQIEMVFAYRAIMERACNLFNVQFQVPVPESDTPSTAQKIFYLTKLEIDKLKINSLHRRLIEDDAVELDSAWRDKVHSYVAIIRGLVEKAELPIEIRDSILTKIHALDAEVDRMRTRIQTFTQVLVGLCAGISAGATALTPAVKLLERVIGAISRLHPNAPSIPALPPPEDFGLESPDQLPPPTSSTIEV